ncbi:MAG: hypothetical protein J7497_06865 [Chitinophagaceae bacterium]|nr:hypothetical protein [Chitinophagaceae bacterium]
MKEKIIAAAAKLRLSGKVGKKIYFEYTSIEGAKRASGQLLLKADNGLDISLTDAQGYSAQYLQSRFRSIARTFEEATLPFPRKGDQVWTESFVNQPMTPGEKKTLPKRDSYFAVNTSLLDCNGRELGSNVEAAFVKQLNAICNGGGIQKAYTIFTIL